MYERRLLRLLGACGALLLLILGRAFQVQVVKADQLLSRSPAAGTCVLPRRGEILWSDGTPMARNDSRFRVLLDVAAFDRPRWSCPDCGDVVAREKPPETCRECGRDGAPSRLPDPDTAALARLLRMDRVKLDEKLARARSPGRKLQWATLLAGHDRLVRDVAADVAAHAADFPGLDVRAEPARLVDPAARSVVGSTRFPDPDDVKRLTAVERRDQGLPVYRTTDLARVLLGAKSLERRFDERLRGVPGLVVRLPARLGEKPPEPIVRKEVQDGLPVRTTLRRGVQEMADDIVSRTTGLAAAAVVLELRTGAIVALASKSDDGLNHAVTPREPGSVYKIVTAFAILEAGLDTSATVRCQGKGKLPGTRAAYTCTGTHGDADFDRAFAQSCNPYHEVRGIELGGAAMAQAAQRLGLYENFGLGIAGEGARTLRAWDASELANVAIGQGPVLTSPLQVAAAYARIAAGGRRITPYIENESPRSPAGATTDAVIARHSARLVAAAAGVVDFGTGQNVAGLAEIRAAGKSGTAEVASKTKNNAWFVAFAPREAPRYVAVVLHEHVDRGHGATLAGPDVARLLEEALRER